MATILTYNGIVLHNVVTREWNQEVRYDESGTDAMFHLFTIRVEGLLHAKHYGTSVTSVSAGADAHTMVDQYEGVHRQILRSRAPLEIITVNHDGAQRKIFICDPAPGDPDAGFANSPGNVMSVNRDVNNGPKPKSFRITQVIGAKCLRVSFEIECAKLICPRPTTSVSGASIGAMPAILSNRWTTNEAMDENMFVTRTIAGKLRLSTAMAVSWIDEKAVVVPGLERGFRRQGIDYTIDKTGLECDYRVVDRQVHSAAPWPATKMDVRHTQSTNDGINVASEVRVILEGPPFADKKALFARAMQIIEAKLNFDAIAHKDAWKKRYIPDQISFTDHIGDRNQIEAVARFIETPGKLKDGPQADLDTMLGNLRAELGAPLKLPYGYDPSRSTPPKIYGYNPPKGEAPAGSVRSPAVWFMLQCYLQQPCVDKHGLPWWGLPTAPIRPPAEPPNTTTPDPDNTPYEPYEGTVDVVRYPYGSLSYPREEKWSDSAKDSVYTFVRASSRYVIDRCRVQLPIAAASVAGADSSRVFDLARPQCRRIIDFDAERAGAWPQVPPPDETYRDGAISGMLVRSWTEAHPPSLTADGVTPLYRATVHYEYALNRPPAPNERFRVGVQPQTRFAKTDSAVQFDPQQAYGNPELGA